MQYVAEVSGKGQDIDRVKEQLLQSNPVLEGKVISSQKSQAGSDTYKNFYCQNAFNTPRKQSSYNNNPEMRW